MHTVSDQSNPPLNLSVGFVIIGRNEGDRLKKGVLAIKELWVNSPIVYVDSGSVDDSVSFAYSKNINVIELDLSVPFTAARARNAGFSLLTEKHPDLSFVQFVDGDCELLPGWIETAIETLQSTKLAAIVSGRRIEKFPEASIYNTIIDIEWNTPAGETIAVLGDMCVNVDVFAELGGFSENVIATEDDELCLRARLAGYKIYRIDAMMSKHDANIMSLNQWFRRAKRGGHGYANIFHLHGNGPDKYFRRELISVLVWGGVVPLAILCSLLFAPLLAGALFLMYVLFILRTSLRRLKKGDPLKIAIVYGALIFTGKVPELAGAFQYWKNHLFSRKHLLIEYK
ncbi:MAG: glycosyltransferase [bacterium]